MRSQVLVQERPTHENGFRSVVFGLQDRGSYILVFQRPGGAPLLDLCFFNGDRETDEAESLAALLNAAVERARAWSTP